MRRKSRPDPLPLELAILHVGDGSWFYAYGVARLLDGRVPPSRSTLLTGGSLYRALQRMEKEGWLTSRLEPAEVGEEARRPRRRLYLVMPLGRDVLKEARRSVLGAHPGAWQPAVELRREIA